jgi:AcrR family transcriptional regulator
MTVREERQHARRLEVAQAAARVIAQHGLADTSMRAIADELGCSVGVLTHHFRNKDEMLLFVHRHIVSELFGSALAAAQGHSGLWRIEAILLNALPDTAARLERWKTWIELLGPTIRHGALLPMEESENRHFLDGLEHELRVVFGNTPPGGIDPSREPRVMMSLLDGIAIDAVLHPALYPPETQRWIVRRYVTGLRGTADEEEKGCPESPVGLSTSAGLLPGGQPNVKPS